MSNEQAHGDPRPIIDPRYLTAAPALPLIYGQLSKAMSDVGAIKKDKTASVGQGGSYKFRGIDDVYNAVQPAFVRHGIVCVPAILDKKMDERTSKNGGTLLHVVLTVQFRYYAADGSFVEAITLGEAMDSGDKACNKAMSAAQKYAHFQVLSIATEEGHDSETETHEIAPRDPVKVIVKKVPATKAKPSAEDRKRELANAPAPNEAQLKSIEAFRADLQAAKTRDEVKVIAHELTNEPDAVKAAIVPDYEKAMARVTSPASNGAAHP